MSVSNSEATVVSVVGTQNGKSSNTTFRHAAQVSQLHVTSLRCVTVIGKDFYSDDSLTVFGYKTIPMGPDSEYNRLYRKAQPR